jgi:hypothetical protein
MSERLVQAQMYHAAIREILMRDWDPIGVAGVHEADDEYDSYIGDIYVMLVRREPVHKLIDYLWWAETTNMGLFGNRQRTERVARLLAEVPSQLSGSV